MKKTLAPFIAVFNRLYDAFCELVPKRHQDAAEALFDSMRDF